MRQTARFFGSSTLIGAMLASAAPAFAAGSITFNDLAPEAASTWAIQSLAQAGVVNGHRDSDGQYIGLFRPSENVTIAEVVKMAVLGAKIAFPPAAVPSNLSAQGTWASGYVNAGAQAGFAVLKDNRTDVYRTATRSEVMQTVRDAFRSVPRGSYGDGPITRGETAVIVASMIGSVPTNVVTAPTVTPPPQSTPTPSPVTPEPVAPTMANATHRVTASANMRSGAAMEYRVVRVLRPGDVLAVTSVSGAWSEVMLADGVKGFVISTSLAPIAGAPETPAAIPAPVPAVAPMPGSNGTVTGPVNVRVRPDVEATALLSIPAGTPIIILDQPNLSWTHIRLQDGREGYVGTKFVKAN